MAMLAGGTHLAGRTPAGLPPPGSALDGVGREASLRHEQGMDTHVQSLERAISNVTASAEFARLRQTENGASLGVVDDL